MNAKHTVSRIFLSSVVVGASVVGLSTTASAAAKLKITVSPNPLVETGQTEVHAVVQVSPAPGFAGKQVLISSPALKSACGGTITFQNLQPPTGSEGGSGTTASPTTSVDSIETTPRRRRQRRRRRLRRQLRLGVQEDQGETPRPIGGQRHRRSQHRGAHPHSGRRGRFAGSRDRDG